MLASPAYLFFKDQRRYRFYLTPSFLRMSSIKHQRVSADWNKLAPTNAVNRYQYGLTQCPRARLRSTKLPAINRMYLSKVMAFSSFPLDSQVAERIHFCWKRE